MKPRPARSLAVLLTLCLVLLFAPYAFAQAIAPTVMPVQPISLVTGVGLVLGLLLGYINQGIASGSILMFGVPALWKPYLSMTAVFLTAFIPQFAAMPSMSAPGLFYALLAGLTSLVTYSAGGTLRHQHDKVVDAKDDGSKDAKDDHPTAPGIKGTGLVAVLATLGICGGLSGLGGLTLAGCAQVDPFLAQFGKVGAEVVKDLQAGETDVQIADDILTMLGANATVEEATNVVLDIVNELIDSGVLSGLALSQAKTIQTEGREALLAKVQAAHAAK